MFHCFLKSNDIKMKNTKYLYRPGTDNGLLVSISDNLKDLGRKPFFDRTIYLFYIVKVS